MRPRIFQLFGRRELAGCECRESGRRRLLSVLQPLVKGDQQRSHSPPEIERVLDILCDVTLQRQRSGAVLPACKEIDSRVRRRDRHPARRPAWCG